MGVPFLMWEAWTVIAWLTDGPTQVTEFRDSTSANWYAARMYEGLAILVSIAVIVYVVRGCVRARRVLTFDVMFCLCGATVFWADLVVNGIHPILMVSSNFLNLNHPCGHMPFVVNPDCGRAPEPFLFWFPLETFGLLGAAIVAAAGVRWARQRWPGISTAKLLGLVLLGGLLVECIFEPPAVALGLWTYNANPLTAIPLGKGGAFRLPVIEIVAAGLWFGLLIAVRVLKDDRGRTLVERGLEQHTRCVRKAISLLALYGVFQFVNIVVATMPLWPLGFYEGPWPRLPKYVVNDVCDAPGVQGTRYGPCPGSPGYRMPGRHSLPGRSP
jgi:hypothetical protein